MLAFVGPIRMHARVFVHCDTFVRPVTGASLRVTSSSCFFDPTRTHTVTHVTQPVQENYHPSLDPSGQRDDLLRAKRKRVALNADVFVRNTFAFLLCVRVK